MTLGRKYGTLSEDRIHYSVRIDLAKQATNRYTTPECPWGFSKGVLDVAQGRRYGAASENRTY